MKKELKDYLHLYLGCDCIWIKPLYPHKMGDKFNLHYDAIQFWCEKIKPILRPLSSMTEDEFAVFNNICDNDFSKMVIVESMSKGGDYTRLAHQNNAFHYLLSKEFDLFGLIESGLAIDKTKLTTCSS